MSAQGKNDTQGINVETRLDKAQSVPSTYVIWYRALLGIIAIAIVGVGFVASPSSRYDPFGARILFAVVAGTGIFLSRWRLVRQRLREWVMVCGYLLFGWYSFLHYLNGMTIEGVISLVPIVILAPALSRGVLSVLSFWAFVVVATVAAYVGVSDPTVPLGVSLTIYSCIVVGLGGMGVSRFRLEEENQRVYASLETKNRKLQSALVEAERARRAQESFLANVSHELRTPLTGVLGILELLKNPTVKNKPELLGVARASGRELLGLINDLLDAARLQSAKVELDPQSVLIREFVSKISRLHEPMAMAKELELTVEIEPDVVDAVEVDPLRLRQILRNLLGNSIKFTNKGSVSLRVSMKPDRRLQFSVLDTGPGLGEDPERLFSRFSQVDESTTRVHGGSGLGLAIARDLAELMGGELIGRNREGGGSIFQLTIPYRLASVSDVDTPVSAVTEARFEGLVLVVDDDPTNRLVIGQLLRSFGVHTCVASDGTEALKMIHERKPSLVLMDCYMPTMDGFDATRALRRSEKQGRTPVVALTASVLASDRAACVDAGMDAHLAKPIEIHALEEVLERFLSTAG